MEIIGNLTDQSEIFAEPFTELWKKLLGTTAFMLNSIGCVIMLHLLVWKDKDLVHITAQH